MEGEEQHHPAQRRVRGAGGAPGTFSGRPVRAVRVVIALAGGHGSQAGPGFAAFDATAGGAARSGASALAIYRTIRDGEPEAAAQATSVHLDNMLEDYRREIQRRVFG